MNETQQDQEMKRTSLKKEWVMPSMTTLSLPLQTATGGSTTTDAGTQS